jgi:hypothetical protein
MNITLKCIFSRNLTHYGRNTSKASLEILNNHLSDIKKAHAIQ